MDATGAVNRLHQIVLAWDYFRLWDRQEKSLGVYDSLRAVPDTFETIEEYKSVFEQLLLEECGALVLRGVEEGEVLEPHHAVTVRSHKAAPFLMVVIKVEEEVAKRISDNDLVLLSKDKASDEGANRSLHTLAFVDGREGPTALRLKALVTDDSQAGNAAGTERVRAMRKGLETPFSGWWLQRLFNASTITREWVALQHAHLMPFADSLLRGKVSAKRAVPVDLDIPPAMAASMERQCNGSQMTALRAGLDGTPLVLIQGPPGTGKTRTILNLLSVVMNAAAKGSLELMPIAGGVGDGNGEGAAAKAAAKAAAAGEAAAAAAASRGGAAEGSTAEERRRWLWALQSPWMFGLETRRDAVGPWPPPEDASDCFGLTLAPKVAPIGRRTGPKAHILVCAPSNSALDEIVLRVMKMGLMDGGGDQFAPSIVRVGVNVHHSVEGVGLEALIASRLGGGAEDGGSKATVPAHLRDKLRHAIISEASIVFSTLSFAGSSLFHRMGRHFDVVVIDEAAQAVEPSVLVPLVMGCKQVFLVGDPVQLPATVISTRAGEHGYEQSMFKRLMAAGYPIHMLEVQYRMHPSISLFPNREFYGGRLLDGEGVEEGTTQPWHSLRCFGPFAFYDVRGRESVPEGSASLVNRTEAAFVIDLFRLMRRHVPELRSGALSVAVISPYKAQVKLLRELFAGALGPAAAKTVDINTIDGFQGREKDVVIFSCVRSTDGRKRRGIGFVADERRINVGLTRARCSLVVVGNARSLSVDARWRGLVASALERRALWSPSKPHDAFLEAAAAGDVGPAPDTANVRKMVGLVEEEEGGGGPGEEGVDWGEGEEEQEGAAGGGGTKGAAAVEDFYGGDTLAEDYFADEPAPQAPAAAAPEPEPEATPQKRGGKRGAAGGGGAAAGGKKTRR